MPHCGLRFFFDLLREPQSTEKQGLKRGGLSGMDSCGLGERKWLPGQCFLSTAMLTYLMKKGVYVSLHFKVIVCPYGSAKAV